jgi:hypothetical protein
VTITRRHLLILLAAFVISRVMLVGVGVVSQRVLPSVEGTEYTHLLDGGPALDMWYRWDAGFYATIATFGYDWFNDRQPAADMAFLPLYPALVGLVSGISGQGCLISHYLSTCATVGGLIVSNVALLLASLLLYDLGRRHFSPATGLRAALLLFVAPNAIFLSGVYTESLFLLLVLLTFALLDRDQFAGAVVAACAACLTRSVGVAIVPALLYWAWHHRSGKQRAISLIGALVPGVLFALYVLGAGLIVGQPLAYFSAYDGIWGRSASPLDAILVYAREPVALLGWSPSWLDLAATIGCLAVSIGVLMRWRPRTWGIFSLAATVIPIASGSLLSMPRFSAVIFPIYLVLARWADRWWRAALVYSMSTALMILFTARFVTWRWIA